MKTVVSQALRDDRRKNLIVTTALLVLVGLVIKMVSPSRTGILIVGGAALIAGYWLFKRPELSTLAFTFILYANLAVLAVRFHGVPQIVAAAASLMPVLPFANYVFLQRQRVIWDRPFSLMLVYLAAMLTASILAYDMKLALSFIVNFLLEGLLLYFLIVNVIRSMTTLKRVIWVLMLAGSVMGGLSIFQELTHTYDNSYGGLAQRREDLDMSEVDFDEYSGSRSAGGPFGGENRYAQVMLVILPLALYLYFVEKNRKARLLAAISGALIFGGIVLSFSRGAFVAFAGLVVAMMFLRFIRPHKILLALPALVLVMGIALPEYYDQVSTVGDLSNLLSSHSEDTRVLDGSFRGRYAQMMAAMRVFIEHPVTGVGPGHYSKFFARRYGNEVGTKFLRSNRRAHNLYLEMVADMGLFGLGAFMAVVLMLLYQLWQARRRFEQSRPELSTLATALILCLLAYLGTALFLQLSYERYYWFMLALAGAVIQVLSLEAARDPVHNEVGA